MILLKANEELRKVFQYLINAVSSNVIWDGIFAVSYNQLILPGTVRSLVFDYDHKKAYSNIIELDIKEEDTIKITDNEMLSNALNMTLYTFGKWKLIKGLKVDKDYAQLNNMFGLILKDVAIEPSCREDNFRFYKDNIQISYEDVIQLIINHTIKEDKEEEEDNKEKEDSSNREKEEENEYKLGLWHNIKWLTKQYTFPKSIRTAEDEKKSRIGNNFYMIDYQCPNCSQKLYIVLYPVDHEFRIETDEGGVYLARAYACNTCNCFYTPRPGKLLGEGDIYELIFEEDRQAYEDYMELLGKSGGRDANYKFNEYETERSKKEETESLEEEIDNLDDMQEEEIEALKEKMEEGFYDQKEVDKYYDKVENYQKKRKQKKEKQKRKDKNNKKDNTNNISGLSKEKKQKEKHSSKDSNNYKGLESNTKENTIIKETNREQIHQKQKEKYDSYMNDLEQLSIPDLHSLHSELMSDSILTEEEKKDYAGQVQKVLYKAEEKQLMENMKSYKSKSYHQLQDIIKQVNKRNYPEKTKKELLKRLKEALITRGKMEIERLFDTSPMQMDKVKFQLLQDKLNEYKEIDITPYRERLEEKRNMAEKQEISNIVNQAGKKNRNSLLKLGEQLKEQGFQQENLAPYLDEIQDQIYELDQKAIDAILPDLLDMSFEEGMKAYKKISEGVFLPELKINTLEMLSKRLTRMKEDESRQLVRKLKRSINGCMKWTERLYYYQYGNETEKEPAKELLIKEKALNTYASERNPYEYPIMVCDASKRNTGKAGFVLTPDHLFYNSLAQNGKIKVEQIEKVETYHNVIGKNVYLMLENGEKIKLPNAVPAKEMELFVRVMDEFIKYLQEKPESRNISYLSKEKHEKKCCLRCGFVYMKGDICPKCGSKFNK